MGSRLSEESQITTALVLSCLAEGEDVEYLCLLTEILSKTFQVLAMNMQIKLTRQTFFKPLSKTHRVL